jgi:predicted N-acetyltransferase YhbS
MQTMREAATEQDWWDVRDLIVRTHGQQPIGWNWDIRHWDGNRYHSERTVPPWPVGLWFRDNVLVGAAHAEGGGDVWLELDESARALEPEMLDWAVDKLSRAEPDGSCRLEAMAWDYDEARHRALTDAGFERQAAGWWLRVMSLTDHRAAPVELTAPYRLATTTPVTCPGDAAKMAALLNASFGRTMHTAAEYVGFTTNSPSFRHDLNLVAVAPDGSFAAHAGVTYDRKNRFGIFEPVCTHPDHRRRGLAGDLMAEGLRRLALIGAISACVETGDAEAANGLYRSIGFATEYRGHWWVKRWR